MTSTVPHGTLVGRDREVAQLADLVAEVTAGRGRSVWVEGEPGIGKSTLLTAGLADAQRLGCEVFWESADEARQRFPLWVLSDCLRIGPRSPDADRAQIAALLRGEGAAGLTPDEAAELAARLAGGALGPRLRRQVAQAVGNPLYVRELVDALRRDRLVQLTDGTAELVGPGSRRPVSFSLAGAIARRLDFLSGRTTDVLRLAALLGPEFTMAYLRAATGQPDEVLAGVVREAV